MNWFGGSIPQAISKAKERNGIFVVFVHDQSESSKAAKESLDSEKVSKILSSEKFVCIKLENGSDEAKQFSQIYPLVLVPSLFLIKGVSGIPLEIIGGQMSEESIITKIEPLSNEANSSSEKKDESLGNGETAQVVKETAGASAVPEEASPPLSSGNQEEPAAATAQEDGPPKAEETQPTSTAGESQTGLAERIVYAKAAVEKQQKGKEAEKQRDLTQKELERRQQGQEMRQAKERREDAELKQLALQRRKEKEEDKYHREQVKAQIAADRLERERREALFKDQTPPQPPAAQPQQPAASSNTGANTRIKFRFPDSSSINGNFANDDTLLVVQNYVRQNAPLQLYNFNLISIIHHRPFTDDQLGSTLTDLGLAPSATINVIPTSSTRSQIVPSGGSVQNMLWTLLSPVFFIVHYIKIFLGLETPPDKKKEESPSQAEPAEASSSKRLKADGYYTTRNRASSKADLNQDVTRREGNIHRLNRGTDDDDENNTWNGNSTQQM